jgi:predicted alpha-1,2-mannosidase
MKTPPSLCLLLPLACMATIAAAQRQASDPVDLVSPHIGGIGLLLSSTEPLMQRPHGMARIAPITTPGIEDPYLADDIYGFLAGPAMLMASTGDMSTEPKSYASAYDHDFETATPYRYQVQLLSSKIDAETTATQDAVIYRFTFPASTHAHLVFSMGTGGALSVVDDRSVEGSAPVEERIAQSISKPGETREYFYAEFSRPVSSYQTWSQGELSHTPHQAGDHIGFVTNGVTQAGEAIEVRVGISYISTHQAKRNLDEQLGTQSFAALVAEARSAWTQALGAIEVTGGTPQQRAIFYTALYRSYGRMTDITEDGRYFSGYDHAVHPAEGHDFYVDDGMWDTFRSLHPLQLLIEPKREEDMIRSYVRMYTQSGWMPAFPSVAGERAVMIGHHADEFILDAYAQGYRDFDVEQAYEGMRKNATEATLLPWQRGPLTSLDKIYFEKGFFPALAYGQTETVSEVTGELRQAVSVTLENGYDDWAVAQLARDLGKTQDAAYFTRLAHNYQNLYDAAIGFMAPKSADGSWVTHFDPTLGGGQGGRDYFTEMDAWVWTFNVQYDVAGLIHLMGGRDAFNAKLDSLFVAPYGTSKYRFLNQFPDATGLVGLYAQGNEPSFHVPYLYDFSGQPWKTERRVRQLMDLWYTDGPRGIPGDDDGGETSSWYVLSALGFYPVCPGSPVYEIGSPLFSKSVIRLGNGHTFTITADQVSAQNKYIQSARLNGRVWQKPWFPHAAIADGGSLTLEMGPAPNPQWGSAEEDAPPSMSHPVSSGASD